MLSQKLTEELIEVKSHLKNAVRISAMNEKTYITKQLSDILFAVDNIERAETLMDKLENRKPGDSGIFGSFFG
jgi:hypothetical protein